MQPTPNLYVRKEPADGDPTLVFTHGYLQTSESTWSQQIDHFRGRVPLVAWDLAGHGKSPEREDYSMSVVMADLEQVLSEIDGDVVLVGHSLGGYAILRRAILDPHCVRGLVLVATGPGFRSEQSLAEWNQSVESQARQAGVSEALAGLAKHDDSVVIDRITELQLPVLVIVGEKDKAFAGATSYFERKLPHAKTVTVPDAGHMVSAHQPATVNRAIEEFLATL